MGFLERLFDYIKKICSSALFWMEGVGRIGLINTLLDLPGLFHTYGGRRAVYGHKSGYTQAGGAVEHGDICHAIDIAKYLVHGNFFHDPRCCCCGPKPRQ